MGDTSYFSRFKIQISFLFLILLSCSSDLEEKLVGTWKGSDFLFVKSEGPDLVATINGGLEQHMKSKLALNDGGSYEKLLGEYDNGKGSWLVEGDQLILTDAGGNRTLYKLLKITDHELVTVHDVALDTANGKLVGKITLSYTR